MHEYFIYYIVSITADELFTADEDDGDIEI